MHSNARRAGRLPRGRARQGGLLNREFYVNDAGNQIEKLASLEARYPVYGREAVPFPEDG
ncbi:MAG: hypothetical protein ACLVL7_10695 [Anaerotruncus massiliensis (ex Togo et al. 2019)]